jgi:hypothetical protein
MKYYLGVKLKGGGVRWAGNVASMGLMRDAYNILVGKSDEK